MIRYVWISLGLCLLCVSCTSPSDNPCSSVTCDAGKICQAGTCIPQCTATQTRCDAVCADLQTDRSHCGRCGNRCREGEICQNNVCTLICASGKTLCDGTCVDTKTDRQHCGSCKQTCKSGELCQTGVCQLSCPIGTTACSGQCVDMQHHPSHCGACGKACSNKQICQVGQCLELTCPASQKECGGVCIDVQNHRTHCGACQNACQDGHICRAGSCVLQCPPSQTVCQDVCVDISSDPAHCGVCNRLCLQGQVCAQGQCKQICQSGRSNCSGACVDLQNSSNHCGRCDNRCKSTEACHAAQCVCAPDLSDCTGSCVDLQINSFHCGSCGKTCPLGQSCLQGKCVAACKPGETNCADLCSDWRTDRNHCGGCGNTCLAAQECCNAGCIDPKTDNKHCGACNKVCPSGYQCENGACACPAPAQICSGACVHLQTDAQHCGKCGTSCKTTETCVAGQCVAAWAVGVGGLTSSSPEGGLSITRDNQGNLYLLGRFSAEIILGSHTVTARDGGLFVAKLDSQLQILWALSPQLQTNGTGAIIVDATGNTYITGHFTSHQAVFGSTTLGNSSAGLSYQAQVFVAKIDAQGQWSWAVSGGGANSDQSHGIGIDGTGNLYIAGTFNTGFATPVSTFGSLTLSSRGNSNDILVAKLDPSGKWLWAQTAGGNNTDQGLALSTDSNGNSYVVGTFEGSAVFGTTTLTAQGNSDVFVAKIDKDGTWLWIVSGGGNSTDIGTHVAHDNSGQVYITGRILGNASFGTTTLTTRGSFDAFVAKLHANGTWAWAQSAGGTSSDYAQNVAVDSSGNVHITGYITSNVGTFGSNSYPSLGGADIFVAKLDSSGKWLWTKMAGGNGDDQGHALILDSTGNIYVTGHFSSGALFGSTTLLSLGESDIFVAKLDSNGNIGSTASWGGKASLPDIGYAIATDSSGQIYVAGSFQGSAAFGSTTLSSHSNSADIFVGKLNQTGQWIWAQAAGGPFDDQAFSITVDSSQNVYLTGQFVANNQPQGGATFGSTTLQSAGQTGDVFVAKLDANGRWLWAKQAGGPLGDAGYGIVSDSTGNTYVVGTFQTSSSGVATFGTTSLSTSGNTDIFVAKLDTSGQWLWVSQAGGNGEDFGWAIALAGNQLYITGQYDSTTRFGGFTLPSRGAKDMFVAQLSTSTGLWQWLRSAGGSNEDAGRAITTDSSGHVYVTGDTFSSSVSPVTFGTTVFSSDTGQDIFVAKLDSTGQWLWTQRAGGSQEDTARGIAADSSGQIWITGFFTQRANFGTFSFSTPTLTSSIFAAKLDTSGAWTGVQTATLPFFAPGHQGHSIATDSTGHALVTGSFFDQILFSQIPLSSRGKQDIFVWKTK